MDNSVQSTSNLERLADDLVASGACKVALPAFIGPTASGKTALAAAVAERVDGEVVNVDSVQIYTHFDIGSGKPDAATLARAPHHLIGIRDPLHEIDAHEFASLAEQKIAEIRARGRQPIVCGGTFLWVRALVYGLAEAPKGDASLRETHVQFAREYGAAALHEKLRIIDPPLYARLHPNDVLRVSRALEVFEIAGKPLSAFQEEHGFRTPKVDAKLFALRHDEPAQTRRIRNRVAQFFAQGWQQEVRALRAAGYEQTRAMGSVGYREVNEALNGVSHADPLEERIVRATRIFARRQRTWLNHSDVTWLDASHL